MCRIMVTTHLLFIIITPINFTNKVIIFTTVLGLLTLPLQLHSCITYGTHKVFLTAWLAETVGSFL